MEEFSWSALTVQLAMGFSLAAVTGFRAFLPLLAAGGCARLGLLPLGESFLWLQSDEALIILGVATVLELLGDKVPLVDHALDAGGALVKPAAGWLVAAAPLLHLDTKWATVLALLTGSTVAGAIHLMRTPIRAASTVTTGGLGNPLISLAEDGASVVGTLLAIFLPLLGFLLICGALAGAVYLWRRRLRRPGAAPALAP